MYFLIYSFNYIIIQNQLDLLIIIIYKYQLLQIINYKHNLYF